MARIRDHGAFLLLALLMPFLVATTLQHEGEGESFLPYLFAAYAVTWAGFFAYAFFLSHKQKELKREIESLRQNLTQHEKAGTRGGNPPTGA